MENKELIQEEINKVFLAENRSKIKEVDDAVEFIKGEIIEYIANPVEDSYSIETPDKNAKILHGYLCGCKTNNNLFLKNLNITVRFIKINKRSSLSYDDLKLNSRSHFDDDISGNITDDLKMSHASIGIEYAFNGNEIDTDILTSLIHHAIFHVYEIYNIKLNNKYSFFYREWIHSKFLKNILKVIDKGELYNFVQNIAKAVYCLCYFKSNAYISASYINIMDRCVFLIEQDELLFSCTKTYKYYNKPLKDIEKTLNLNSLNKQSISFIERNIKDLIQTTVENYNQWNFNNKIESNDITINYNEKDINDYILKIKKTAKNELDKFDKVFPYISQKAVSDRSRKIIGVGEKYFVFDDDSFGLCDF